MKGNRVLLIGYVGQHLASKKMDNGIKRVGIRMATHYDYKNKKGDKIDKTVWHNVVAWDGTADYAERSFVKGSKIMVEGMIDYCVFKNKEGGTIYRTQIKATSLINLDR